MSRHPLRVGRNPAWARWYHAPRAAAGTHLHHRAGLLQVLAHGHHGGANGHPAAWAAWASRGHGASGAGREPGPHLLLLRVHHGLSHLLLLHAESVLHLELLLKLCPHLRSWRSRDWMRRPVTPDDLVRQSRSLRHLLLHVRRHPTTDHRIYSRLHGRPARLRSHAHGSWRKPWLAWHSARLRRLHLVVGANRHSGLAGGGWHAAGWRMHWSWLLLKLLLLRHLLLRSLYLLRVWSLLRRLPLLLLSRLRLPCLNRDGRWPCW